MTLRVGVAIIAYDRPVHLAATLRHLQHSMASGPTLPVHIFQDYGGPQPSRAWQQAHEIARACAGDRLTVRSERLREENVARGTTELLASFDAAIVLEDDVCVARDFIPFVYECLQRHAESTDVFSVCGEQLMFPELIAQPEHTWFARFFQRRGFAVWRRSWKHYSPECPGWQDMIANPVRRSEFDIFGRTLLSDLLVRMIHENDPTYDVRWYYNMFTHGAYSIFPTRCLVFNTGYMGGTHFSWRAAGILAPVARRLGMAKSCYQRFYRGRERRAGNRAALEGGAALPASTFIHSDYARRADQHVRYATLLKRYQPRHA